MNKIFIIIIVIVVSVGVFLVYQSRDNSSVKNYVGNSAEECSRIQVMCVEGFQYFQDDNGCGCEEI